MPSSLRFSSIPGFPAVFGSGASGAEADHYIVLGFLQAEASLLDFGSNPRHVGHSPRHDNVLSLRKPCVEFFQEAPVALVQKVIPQFLLTTGRRRESH